jgi:cyclophilin family peptidyl-prolyl cis-trans isomerase
MKKIFLILAILTLSLTSCKKSDSASQSTDSTKVADTAQLAPPPTISTDTTKSIDVKPIATHTGVISTDMGDIEFELYGKDAPKAVENFAGLIKKGYYNGIKFHRCIPNFVIQGGDPSSKDNSKRDQWGMGGESIFGKTFEDELAPTPSFKRGYIDGCFAMANSGPNTNGSQFFICSGQGAQTSLGAMPNYTIFGFVTKGIDVVAKIAQTGASGEKPENPVTMKKVTIKEIK